MWVLIGYNFDRLGYIYVIPVAYERLAPWGPWTKPAIYQFLNEKKLGCQCSLSFTYDLLVPLFIMLLRVIAVAASLVCSSLAAAVNGSGIFAPDGSIYESPDPNLVTGKRGLWSDSGERLTNALRFRSGLNPLPPKVTRTSSARTMPTYGSPHHSDVSI